jgi:hypothetical protein
MSWLTYLEQCVLAFIQRLRREAAILEEADRLML